jgi:hypothetical protein
MNKDITRRIVAEFFGTFWLTFGGCGAAVLAAAFPSLGIGWSTSSKPKWSRNGECTEGLHAFSMPHWRAPGVQRSSDIGVRGAGPIYKRQRPA